MNGTRELNERTSPSGHLRMKIKLFEFREQHENFSSFVMQIGRFLSNQQEILFISKTDDVIERKFFLNEQFLTQNMRALWTLSYSQCLFNLVYLSRH
jgi:hypothetical protein